MKKRVNVMISEKNLKYLDEHAKAYGVSRSDVINILVGSHADDYNDFVRDFFDSIDTSDFIVK